MKNSQISIDRRDIRIAMIAPAKTTLQAFITRSALLGILLALILILPTRAFGILKALGENNNDQRREVAHIARTLNATDTAHLHYIHSSGSKLIEIGEATGTLPGNMTARINVGPVISGTFTINVRSGGSIIGHGSAISHGSGRYESFRGSLTVSGGTGRYAHAHGHAGLYGTFARRPPNPRESYALVVQTTGQLSY